MYQNTIYISISSVFLDIAKFTDFRWKNADVSRTQGLCQVIHIFCIFFGEGITAPSFIIVGYVWQILGRAGLFGPPPIREQRRKSPSWIGLRLHLHINNKNIHQRKTWNCLIFIVVIEKLAKSREEKNVQFSKYINLLEHRIYEEQYIILNAHNFWTKLSASNPS